MFGGWGLDVLQLMLMMLGCLGGQGPGVLQLTVMMVGVWRLWPRRSPADAHGAGGVFRGSGPRRFPADAHDAGVFGGWGLDVLQLMLMMLGCLGGQGPGVFQLMLMMVRVWGLWPR